MGPFNFTKENIMVRVALWVRLEAKAGKEAAVEAFLKGGLALANQEPATTAWFALKIGPSTFGIFDAFPDDAGRTAHLTGPIAAALMANAAALLSSPPSIEKVDVLAAKLPAGNRENHIL
jgi:quinol monooxygenase YgiN